ncbi:PREDICTED: LOW QUALITY PROTEIN: uncharacterized protein LOC103589507 [Galeopterus variegatus]|uniref:Large ribosomal subunit protein eL34 n=1 Tax=Galeopterus variegatus TaxID=482537 RepID=A0ABM0QMZ7_GALVR|nr:PREDICTED: LOW QUALITY PROTEIN: uncharacterized protein LOC103589507 [Galeopterus variegatus]
MAQRLTHHRGRLSYNTASNKTGLSRTPGNRTVYLYTKKVGKALKSACSVCPGRLPVVHVVRPQVLMRLPTMKKTCYGGSMCANCVCDRVKRAFLTEEQAVIVKALTAQAQSPKAKFKNKAHVCLLPSCLMECPVHNGSQYSKPQPAHPASHSLGLLISHHGARYPESFLYTLRRPSTWSHVSSGSQVHRNAATRYHMLEGSHISIPSQRACAPLHAHPAKTTPIVGLDHRSSTWSCAGPESRRRKKYRVAASKVDILYSSDAGCADQRFTATAAFNTKVKYTIVATSQGVRGRT